MKKFLKITAVLALAAMIASNASAAESWGTLNQQVIELYQKKYYTKAVPLAQRALDVAESDYGSNSPETVLALNNLAMLYKKTKKYKAAEPLYQRSLSISEKLVGPNHPDLGVPLNNLAMYYDSQKEYKKADKLSERAIAILDKAYGPKSPYVAQAHERYEAMKKARSTKSD